MMQPRLFNCILHCPWSKFNSQWLTPTPQRRIVLWLKMFKCITTNTEMDISQSEWVLEALAIAIFWVPKLWGSHGCVRAEATVMGAGHSRGVSSSCSSGRFQYFDHQYCNIISIEYRNTDIRKKRLAYSQGLVFYSPQGQCPCVQLPLTRISLEGKSTISGRRTDAEKLFLDSRLCFSCISGPSKSA